MILRLLAVGVGAAVLGFLLALLLGSWGAATFGEEGWFTVCIFGGLALGVISALVMSPWINGDR